MTIRVYGVATFSGSQCVYHTDCDTMAEARKVAQEYKDNGYTRVVGEYLEDSLNGEEV